MKRIISITLVLMLLVAQVVSAAEIKDTKAYFDIVSFGILEGDENGDLRLGDNLTRVEFAAVMTRLLRYEDVAATFKNSAANFNDVGEDDWFAGYVGAVCATGIMNGVSEYSFDPGSIVTYEQAVKTLVVSLGYRSLAENKGGYPGGYMAVGGNLGLTANVPYENPLTREGVMKLLYNALDINMLVMDIGKEESYKVEPGKTLRSMYLNEDGDVVVLKDEGIVTANADTYLTSANASLKRDEVEINDVKYKVGSTDAYSFIGQSVEYYAISDGGGVKTLISIRASRNTTVTEIDFSSVLKSSLSEIEYETDGKIETQNISSAKIVRNGRMVLLPTDDHLVTEKGGIKLIDNDGDEDADVVFVTDWENVRVKGVKNNTVEFVAGDKFNNSKFFNIDLDDKDVHYVLKNAEGKEIMPEEIQNDSILSISADAGYNFYNIVVSDKTVEGTISEISDDSVIINAEAYSKYEEDDLDIRVGDSVKAFLDFNGYVVSVEESETIKNYGYILGVQGGSSIAKKLQVKFVIGTQVNFEYDKNKEDLDDTNLIPIINCKNSDVKVFSVADKLTVDGTSFKTMESKTNAITPGLYTFETNADGELKTLVSAEHSGGGTAMTYNAYDKTFAGNSFRTPFAIDEKTVVICLPTNGDASDEDYFVPLKISNKATNPSFFAVGYDYDTDTKRVKALIFYDVMRKSDVLNISESTSSVGMVSKAIEALDENGETKTKISIVDKSGTKEYLINDIPGKNDVLKSLKTGDLIFYEVDLMGNLSNAQVIRSFSEGKEAFDDTVEVFGYIKDVEYDELHLSTGNLVADVTVDTAKGIGTVSIPQRNLPQIFIYDKEKEIVESAGIDVIYPKGEDETFYALKPTEGDGVAKVCVICR